jgi:hypothetical protein
VAFFLWTAALGMILTIENLRKRQVIIINWCCISAGEYVNHPLLHFPVAQELWNMVFVLFGVSWVMLRGVVELLASWQGRFGRSDTGVLWKAIPHCLMWCLWWERNARTFDGEENTTPDLKLSFSLSSI